MSGHSHLNEAPSDLVQNVILTISSSRGGSSVFAELLRRCSNFIHFRAEINPILNRCGLTYPRSSNSDFLSFDHLTPEIKTQISRELTSEWGTPDLGPLTSEEIETYAGVVTRRLSFQWPQYLFQVEKIKEWIEITFRYFERSHAWKIGEIKDPQLFWCYFIHLTRKTFPKVNPYYYDLNPQWVKLFFPELEIPEGPPSSSLIEEPPFIIPLPLKPPTQAELIQKPLVIKTPSNCYRLGFLKALFPNAQVWLLHLTRNAPHSINGLMDGWCHRGFFSHFIPKKLKISGYSDRFPKWGQDWWNFDLPPGWEEYTSRSLADVCAFQWYSTHHAVFEYLSQNPHFNYLKIRSEDVLSPSEQTRLMVAQNIEGWLNLDPGRSPLTETLRNTIDPVMATHPPKKDRWLEKANQILPVLEQNHIKEMIEKLGYNFDDLRN